MFHGEHLTESLVAVKWLPSPHLIRKNIFNLINNLLVKSFSWVFTFCCSHGGSEVPKKSKCIFIKGTFVHVSMEEGISIPSVVWCHLIITLFKGAPIDWPWIVTCSSDKTKLTARLRVFVQCNMELCQELQTLSIGVCFTKLLPETKVTRYKHLLSGGVVAVRHEDLEKALAADLQPQAPPTALVPIPPPPLPEASCVLYYTTATSNQVISLNKRYSTSADVEYNSTGTFNQMYYSDPEMVNRKRDLPLTVHFLYQCHIVFRHDPTPLGREAVVSLLILMAEMNMITDYDQFFHLIITMINIGPIFHKTHILRTFWHKNVIFQTHKSGEN